MDSNTIEIIYNSDDAAILTGWKVRPGQLVKKNKLLFTYETSIELKYLCPTSGFIRKIFKRSHEELNHGDVLALIEKCSHSSIVRDICMRCGLQSEIKTTQTFMKQLHGLENIVVTDDLKALDISKTYMNKLLESKKLYLIVDLDNTIVHTTSSDVPSNLKDVFPLRLEYDRKNRHIRLRPYTEKFLEKISRYYHLLVFTMGGRIYANAITKYLDPERKYFENRIFSRDDSVDSMLKSPNLKHMFPCGDNMVCMIDDRDDVWEYAPNLIKVKRYSFFDKPKESKVSKNVNSDEDKEKKILEWEDDDDYLIHLENLLIKIHSLFYEQSDSEQQTSEIDQNKQKNLKVIIPQEKSKVFKGCNIYFSGVGERMLDTEAYGFLTSFGANVQPILITEEGPSKTTHVIGKANESAIILARENNIITVNLDWLLDCCERWERFDEYSYPITKQLTNNYLKYVKYFEFNKPAMIISKSQIKQDEDDVLTTANQLLNALFY